MIMWTLCEFSLHSFLKVYSLKKSHAHFGFKSKQSFGYGYLEKNRPGFVLFLCLILKACAVSDLRHPVALRRTSEACICSLRSS